MKTFVKQFKTDYGDLSNEINDYAKSKNLEIISVSIAEKWGYLVVFVVFKVGL